MPGLILGIGAKGTSACVMAIGRGYAKCQDLLYVTDLQAPQSRQIKNFPSPVQVRTNRVFSVLFSLFFPQFRLGRGACVRAEEQCASAMVDSRFSRFVFCSAQKGYLRARTSPASFNDRSSRNHCSPFLICRILIGGVRIPPYGREGWRARVVRVVLPPHGGWVASAARRCGVAVGAGACVCGGQGVYVLLAEHV